MGLPSSPIQHRVLQRVLDTPPHRTGRETLASSGSCHPAKATAFHHGVRFFQANLLTRRDVDDPSPLLRGHYPASSLLRDGPPLQGASVFPPNECFSLVRFPLASPNNFSSSV
jgi:hypothetical protein